MGIYGESMTLVTEGRFFKFKNRKNKNRKRPTNNFNKTPEIVEDKKCSGHFQFYKDYFKNNIDRIFCKVTLETTESYFNEIKNIFGFDNIKDIEVFYKKEYNKKEFEYNDDDLMEAYDDEDYFRKDIRNRIIINEKLLEEYRRKEFINKGIKYDIKNPFNSAVQLQIDLCEFARDLMNEMISEFYDIY